MESCERTMTRRLVARVIPGWKWEIGLGICLAVVLATTTYAQTTEADSSDTHGQWHNSVHGVTQSADVSSSSNGVTVNIAINRDNQETAASPGSPGGQITESPRGGQHFEG